MKIGKCCLIIMLCVHGVSEAATLTTDGLVVISNSYMLGGVEIFPSVQPQTNNSVLYYSLNTGGTNVADESGNGNAGTVVNAVWTNSAKVGGGYVFDGAGDYIQAVDSASLDIQGAITMSAWIKPNTLSGVRCIVAKHDDQAARAYNFYQDDAKLSFQLSSSGNGLGAYGGSTAASVLSTNWNHVVLTWDGTLNQNLFVYVNGNPVSLAIVDTAMSDTIFNSAMPLRVGTKSNGGWDFIGLIDDVRVMGRALSASEVMSLYRQGAGQIPITNEALKVNGTANIKRIVPQGDIGMGAYTNGP